MRGSLVGGWSLYVLTVVVLLWRAVSWIAAGAAPTAALPTENWLTARAPFRSYILWLLFIVTVDISSCWFIVTVDIGWCCGVLLCHVVKLPDHPPLPPRGDVRSGVVASREADMATGACGPRGWWWRVRRSRSLRCWSGRGFGGASPVSGLVQHLRRLDPVGWHGDGLATHGDLERLLPA
jgi:hypothetical protein